MQCQKFFGSEKILIVRIKDSAFMFFLKCEVFTPLEFFINLPHNSHCIGFMKVKEMGQKVIRRHLKKSNNQTYIHLLSLFWLFLKEIKKKFAMHKFCLRNVKKQLKAIRLIYIQFKTNLYISFPQLFLNSSFPFLRVEEESKNKMRTIIYLWRAIAQILNDARLIQSFYQKWIVVHLEALGQKTQPAVVSSAHPSSLDQTHNIHGCLIDQNLLMELSLFSNWVVSIELSDEVEEDSDESDVKEELTGGCEFVEGCIC
ncbi:hypothetical protein BpHYR1_029993 [Brachionus plicatilis]|uniref:Uncharacterized protein n=1 Tax=Brachionus plicatilis TaxID=10195 RepID=A0A3M7QTF2_BRAPC|nr:hypothetical protein BpHYR1_029993 [Brachionus plicatilis]